jgi:opine dehydrogenase
VSERARIAVLGAGPGGLATAAPLALLGYDVALFNRSSEALRPVRERGGIEIEGSLGERLVPLAVVSSDPAEAFVGRHIIVIVVPAYGQVPLLRTALPYLRPESVVVFLTGSCATLEAAGVLAEAGVDPRSGVLLGETVSLPQSGRMVGPGRVRIRMSNARLRAAAFPATRSAELFARLDGLFALRPTPNVLDPGLNNPNFLIHPAPMLLNYAAVERANGRLSIMNEGMTPSVLRCLDAVDAEKRAVAEAYGLEPIAVDDLYHEIGSTPDVFRKPGEPFGLNDRVWPRYVKEDVPYGTVLISSLGALARVRTPVCDGINTLLSVAADEDFSLTGRTAERLGLVGMTVREISEYVTTGTRVRH